MSRKLLFPLFAAVLLATAALAASASNYAAAKSLIVAEASAGAAGGGTDAKRGGAVGTFVSGHRRSRRAVYGHGVVFGYSSGAKKAGGSTTRSR